MAVKRGDRGEEVKKLQREINDAGYTPKLKVDGVYGPLTEKGNTWFAKQDPAGSEAGVRVDTGDPDRYTDPDSDARFNGLGGNPEIWYNSDTKESYIIYFVPGTEPPIPTYWRIPKDLHLEAYFGDKEVQYDRVITADDLSSMGAIYQGINTELVDRDGDPMVLIAERLASDMEVRPYLKDPEIAAIIMAAALEGVAPTQADFEKTLWWNGKTEGERNWLLKTAADPKTAQQALESERIAVRQRLIAAGVFNPPDSLVNLLADNFTMGQWDSTKQTEQINVVADPAYDGVMDTSVEEVLDGLEGGAGSLDRNTDEVKWVEEEALRQLGPVHGTLTEQQIAEIAGRIRNDPNYRDTWVGELQGQRLAMYPAYTDTTASYDEIAQPWRSVYFQTLGVDPDETNDQFQAMLQRNDLAESKKELRTYGLETGNEKVTTEAFGSLARSMGGNVRRVV